MAISSIHSWLTHNGSFSAGVSLLKLHGEPSSAQLFLFAQGETAYSRGVLTDVLREIDARASRPRPQSIDHAGRTPSTALQERATKRSYTPRPFEDVREGDLPPALRQVRRELMEKHRNMSWMRSRLPLLPDGQVLRDHARSIVELRKEIQSGWARIEAFLATGIIVSPAPDPPPLDAAALVRALNRLRVARSRAKKKPDNAAELAGIETELNKVQRQLDGAPAQV
jgi:hypothetical protein